MIIRECALNKMGTAGNGGAKNDKTAMPRHREMAGLLDFAHKVWYATFGILAQTHRACAAECRNNNYETNWSAAALFEGSHYDFSKRQAAI